MEVSAAMVSKLILFYRAIRIIIIDPQALFSLTILDPVICEDIHSRIRLIALILDIMITA